MSTREVILELLRAGPLTAQELVARSSGRLSVVGETIPTLTRLEVEGVIHSRPAPYVLDRRVYRISQPQG